MISFHFVKSTEITGYPIGIKVRHEMKKHRISNEFHNQFRGSQQVNVIIINEFFDFSPK
jgi:hypothetical protein